MNVEVKRQKDNLCQQIAYWGYGSVRFLGTFALVAPTWLSVCVSAYISAAATRKIFVKFDISNFYVNLSRKSRFHKNRAKNIGRNALNVY
jgi:hypothetical protein